MQDSSSKISVGSLKLGAASGQTYCKAAGRFFDLSEGESGGRDSGEHVMCRPLRSAGCLHNVLRSGSSASALDEDTVTRKKRGLGSSGVKDDFRLVLNVQLLCYLHWQWVGALRGRAFNWMPLLRSKGRFDWA